MTDINKIRARNVKKKMTIDTWNHVRYTKKKMNRSDDVEQSTNNNVITAEENKRKQTIPS